MKPTTRSYYEEAVARAVAEIRASLDDALELEGLARRAALAPLHFHRIFRGLAGETPLALHRRLRLERAATALASRDAAVTRIAFEAGYETHESFTRAFREAFGASPTEFREAASSPATPWTTASRASLPSPSGIHYASPVDELVHLRGRDETVAVTMHRLPEQRVVAVAHRGPYSAISEAFAELDRLVRPSTLLSLPGLQLVAIHHDDPEAKSPAELRADAGLVVPADAVAPPGLDEVLIPAGLYARAVHLGPYETLGDTWSRLMGGWLGTSDYRVGHGPSYERYVNMPMDVAPSELETELYVPIVEAASTPGTPA